MVELEVVQRFLSQLDLDDILQTELGTWHLNFNGIVGATENSSPVKSLKTKNSRRVVPLHPHVIELGLIDYITMLREAGHTRLFPELRWDALKGYGKEAGKWFNDEYLGRTLNIERNRKKCFHSFRHGFSTELDGLETHTPAVKTLMGHVKGGSESEKRYIKSRGADKLSGYVGRLMFPALSNVARFDSASGMKALTVALKRKHTRERAARRRTRADQS